MSPIHETRMKAAKRAINAVYNDTSVSQEETKDDLKRLRELIDEMLESLDD
jgi:hypothetical protein